MKFAAYSLSIPALLTCGIVHAQSSVTIYGIVDASIESISSGGVSATRLLSGGTYQSRLGFRGQEDLGGGLKAIFNLENRFTMDDGAMVGGLGFGGRSVVGLDGPWGTIVAGRDYVPLYQIKTTSNPFGYNSYSPAQLMMVGPATRSNNALRYDSPKLGGASFAAIYGLGDENPANDQAGRQAGLAAQYSFGNTWLGAAWNRVTVRSGAVRSTDEYLVGARHTINAISLYANYWQYRTDNVTLPDAAVSQAMVGVSVPLYAGGTLLAAYSQRRTLRPSTANADDATQIAIGYEHSLSKRTTLYAHYTTLKNKGRSNLKVSDFANTGTASTGFSDPRALQLGFRHFF